MYGSFVHSYMNAQLCCCRKYGLGTDKFTNYFKIKLKKICKFKISQVAADAASQIIALIVVEVLLDKALVMPVYKIQA